MEDRLQKIKDGNGPLNYSETTWLVSEIHKLREQREAFQREAARLADQLISIHSSLAKEMPWAARSPDDVGVLLTTLIYQRRGVMAELAEIHDLLAEALGYQKAPTLEEDLGCPCPGAYVTGDHTAGTLAMQAAKTLKRRAAGKVFDEAQRELTKIYEALARENLSERPADSYASQGASIAVQQIVELQLELAAANQRRNDYREVWDNYERATNNAVDQIVELQRELAELKGTKKAELRREIEALRYACSCPYNTEMDYLARDAACPTHGDEAHNMELAGKKAIATLTYVRKYFMGSEHGHEV